MTSSRLFMFPLLAFACFSSLAHAQQIVPDSGAIERQLRQDGSRPPASTPRVPTKKPDEAREGQTVTVRAFSFHGVSLFPVSELEKVAEPYLGRALTFGRLEEVTQEIAEYYRQRGYFARVYLPEQEIGDGHVRIEVIEGRLGDVKIDGDAKRADVEYVKRIVLGDMRYGAPYSARRLERGLLIANDLPGIAAIGKLSADDKVGQSDFALTVKDTPLFSGDLGFNNYSSKSIDRYQGNAGVSVNNLTGRGDQLRVRALGSRNLGYGQAEYNLPLGTDGLMAGVSANYLQYELGDQFESLDSEGSSHTLSGHLRYPLIRSDEHSLWVQLEYDNRHYHDEAFNVTTQRKELNVIDASLNGEWKDPFLGGGASQYSVVLAMGEVNLDDPSALAADQAGPGTDGGYAKLNLSISRDQALGKSEGWFIRGRLSAQLAAGNLDSSEKFSLGGPYGVRAYPVNEASGDDGALFNVELHKVIDSWDLYGFADAGVIRQYHDSWTGWSVGSGTPNGYWLGGIGIGVSYVLHQNTSLSGVFALPIGSNQGSTPDHNQDGSHHGPRIWAGLTYYF